MTEQPVDGRTMRGARARRALVDATLVVIERDGIGGVTHRNVTREAGVPATSAAYHFDSINDLLEQTLLSADAKASEALDAITTQPDPIAALCRWLVRDFNEERSRLIAEYELFLYAARTPSMRAAANGWLANLNALVSTWTACPRTARVICAYIDGLLLQALVSGAAPEAEELEASIRSLVSA